MDAVTNSRAADMTGFTRDEHVINGIKTVVYSIGSGPDLVFLHGTGTFTGFAFARDWARQHKVIIPFNPNFGESGDDPSLDSIEDYVLHYLDLFDHLSVVVAGQAALVRARAAVDGQEADEVGEEGERGRLEFGVLVQPVVHLPRLVPDPQVVGAVAHHLEEYHEVG